MATVYSQKARPQILTPFKVGMQVYKDGVPHVIVVVDCWSVDETYLAIQKDIRIPEFTIVEVGEIQLEAPQN
jgi:hypothetical protein